MLNKTKSKLKPIVSIISLLLFLISFNACNESSDDTITTPTNDAELEKELDQIMSNFHSRIVDIAEYLELTDDQVSQLKEFINSKRETLREGFQGNRRGNYRGNHRGEGNWRNFDRSQMREKMKEMRGELQNFLESILTDEQIAKYEEFKAKMENGEFFKERFNKWFSNLAVELELTDDQQAQLKALFESRRDKMKELRESGISREEMKEQMEEFGTEMQDELVNILSEEQLTKFEKLMKEHKGRFGNHGGNGRGHYGFPFGNNPE